MKRRSSGGMPDYAPPPEDQALELGPRQPLYAVLYLALLVAWVPTKVRAVARWLSGGARPRPPPVPVPVADGCDSIRGIGIPPRRILSLLELELDPAQVAVVTAALGGAIDVGAFSIASTVQRPADAFDYGSGSGSDSDSDSYSSSHHSDVHYGYPPIQSLEAGDDRLFLLASTASASDPPRQGDRLCRLSDVQENPWIITASTERFADPCDLTDETTRTWVMRLKTTTKLVCLSKRQLHEQNQELAEECFAVVSEQSLELILEVACLFCDARWSDVHILQQLTVFDALVDVLFNIKDLCFSGSGEVAGIINKMVNAFKGVIQRTSNDIRSCKESVIHPATFILIQVLEFFCRNRDMVQSILESGDYNTGPCSDMFDCLVSKLNECAEIIFQEKGQRWIFFLNNINYVLQKECHSALLPPNVVRDLGSLIDRSIKSYLEEYWVAPVRYLDGDSLRKPCRSSLDKFTEEFCTIYDSQRTWKAQPWLKARLREEIVELVVPEYVNFLMVLQENPGSWLKRMCRVRSEKPIHTAERLEQLIRELFER